MESTLQYIEKRMKAKGFDDFHIEPISVFAEHEQFDIQANNEFYFLLNEELQKGTIIQSDTEVLVVKPYQTKSQTSFLKEFTGRIQIYQTESTGQTFEFLKVIPQ